MVKPQVISCNTQEEYNLLMEWLSENGYKWAGGRQLLQVNKYEHTKNGWGIAITSDKLVYHSTSDYFRYEDKSYGPVVEFKDFMQEQGICTDEGILDIEF